MSTCFYEYDYNIEIIFSNIELLTKFLNSKFLLSDKQLSFFNTNFVQNIKINAHLRVIIVAVIQQTFYDQFRLFQLV